MLASLRASAVTTPSQCAHRSGVRIDHHVGRAAHEKRRVLVNDVVGGLEPRDIMVADISSDCAPSGTSTAETEQRPAFYGGRGARRARAASPRGRPHRQKLPSRCGSRPSRQEQSVCQRKARLVTVQKNARQQLRAGLGEFKSIASARIDRWRYRLRWREQIRGLAGYRPADGLRRDPALARSNRAQPPAEPSVSDASPTTVAGAGSIIANSIARRWRKLRPQVFTIKHAAGVPVECGNEWSVLAKSRYCPGGRHRRGWYDSDGQRQSWRRERRGPARGTAVPAMRG